MAQPIRDTEFMDDMSSGVDGDLVKYAVEYSLTPFPRPNVIENPTLAHNMGDEFYDANGGLQGDDFYDARGESNDSFADESMPDSFDGGEDYSNLTLVSKKKRAKFNKGLKKFGKNLEKVGKAGLQALTSPKGSAEMPVMPPPPPVPVSKGGWAGLSTGAKAAIIVGGLAVLGTAGYFLMKKK